MASGGPGDHWLTDLTKWGLPAFGEPADSAIRDIIRFGGQQVLEASPWRERLTHVWPRWSSSPEQVEALKQCTGELISLRDQLERDAIARGWELD